MTFTFSCDNAHGSQRALYETKVLLLAAGWTCEGSGDGTGGNFSPTGDVISTFSTTTDAVANACTNRRAWWRMVAPDGVRELLFQHAAFNTATDYISLAYSRAAGFIGTGDGALAANVAPTATDSFLVMGERRPSLNMNGTSIANGDTITRADYIIGDADEGWSFAVYLRNSSGQIVGGFIYEMLLDAHPNDEDPYIIWSPGTYSAPFNTPTGTLSSHYSAGWSYRDPGVSGVSTISQSNFGPWGRPPRSAPREDAAQRWGILRPAYYGQTNVLNPGGANPYDGEIDLIGPCYYWSGITMPTTGTPPFSNSEMYAGPSVYGGIKGSSRFIRKLSTASGVNNRDVTASRTLFAQAGGFWLLWDGATLPASGAEVDSNLVSDMVSGTFDPWGGFLGGPPDVELITSPGAIAFDDEVRFDVQGSGLFGVVITAEYGDRTEVIFEGELDLSSVAIAPYAMTVTPNGAGFFVDLERAPGWAEAVVLRVEATNGAGLDGDEGSFTISPALAPSFDFAPNGGVITTDAELDVTITEGANGIEHVLVYAEFADRTELVYDDGAGEGYTVSETPSAGELLLEITRDGIGWGTDFVLRAVLIDEAGDRFEDTGSFDVDPEVVDVIDTTAPVISNPQPPPGTPIARTQAVSVDVTDDTGLFRRILLGVELAGLVELCWDGDQWLGHYEAGPCVRTPITNGFRFTVLRTGGWDTSPTLRVYAFDRGGNEA